MSSLNNYFGAAIRKNPLLTKAQEIELSKKAKTGDVSARKKLIESNYRLVISIAKKYHRKEFNFDDLLQESSIGLLKAVDRFDPTLGFKFSTYACWWIKQAALQYINENTSNIKVPTHSRMLNSRINKAFRELEEITGEQPSLEEVADHVGESLKKIKYTIRANGRLISLSEERSEDSKQTLEDKMFDNEYSENPLQTIENKELVEIIKRNLSLLSPKEEKIIRLRFGIGESSDNVEEFPVTQEMLGYLYEKK
jgi:RNA polymerase primary sigma factor